MPPLRERGADVMALAHHFLTRFAEENHKRIVGFTDAARTRLLSHRWPGNVRELENVLRSATLFAETDELGVDDLAAFAESFVPREDAPPAARRAEARATSEAPLESLVYNEVRAGSTSLFDMKKRLERECIVRALTESNGNITRAAALLGMKRPRLSQLVKEYELGDLGK
jgi:DNA-binding NtrC family response regulator